MDNDWNIEVPLNIVILKKLSLKNMNFFFIYLKFMISLIQTIFLTIKQFKLYLLCIIKCLEN